MNDLDPMKLLVAGCAMFLAVIGIMLGLGARRHQKNLREHELESK